MKDKLSLTGETECEARRCQTLAEIDVQPSILSKLCKGLPEMQNSKLATVTEKPKPGCIDK